MLQPKKTKYRKAFKGRIHGAAKGGFSLNFGSYGLKTVEPERITARQIEAARRAITRQMKRQGRVWIRVFPDFRSLTSDQLSDELLKLKKEQFNLRFQAATGQMEKTHRVSEVRKDIARLSTLLREKRSTAA